MQSTFRRKRGKIVTHIPEIDWYLISTCIIYEKQDYCMRGEDWDPIIGLTRPHCYVCPKPWPGFPTSYVVVYFMSRRVVIVDIDGIIDHHYLREYHTLQGDNSLKSVERFGHMMSVCRFQASRLSKPQREKLLCG